MDKAVIVIKKRFRRRYNTEGKNPLLPEDIVKMLGWCLRCTYFQFQGEFYLQIHGTVMGSPVSPILCNIYMEKSEQETLAMAKHPPEWWKRYVDDTYTTLKKVHIQAFNNLLNSLDKNIKWTTEGELTTVLPVEEKMTVRNVRALAFLDTWSVIKEDGTIKISMFKKETHMDQYLNFATNHPLEHR